MRNLTLEDLPTPTDVELARGEKFRKETARERVIHDATNLADQGSRHHRNRG